MKSWANYTIYMTLTIFILCYVSYDEGANFAQLIQKRQSARALNIADYSGSNTETSSGQQVQSAKQNIAYIHIGKTGGTSVACLIRKAQELYNTRQRVCERVDRSLNKLLEGNSESYISQQVTGAYHGRKDEEYDKYALYLVTARNPIDRFISWYLYQHPENGYEGWNIKNYHLRPSYKVFTCYPELNQLATYGLQTDKQKNEIYYQNLSEAQQKNETYCKRIANNCVSGRDHGCSHMHFNYQWYLNDIVHNEHKQFYVIRTEYQDYDWSIINNILGSYVNQQQYQHQQLGLKKVSHHTNRFTGKVKIRNVDNTTISQEGIRNTCRMLCKEIQTYKQLLLRAFNLKEDEKNKSIGSVASVCPIETAYNSVDQCVY